MTLQRDAKFEEKLTFGSKNLMKILVSFNGTVASMKICTLMCYFFRKYVIFEPKKYRRVMCLNTEE